jgi:N-formylglutamate deformylase
MSFPFVVSVPHAGLDMPEELSGLCTLDPRHVAEDGDEGAATIYAPLGELAAHFVTTSVARAFVDMNRAEDDRRKDGVVKTHTCLDVPIYERPLSEPLVQSLLAAYHRPYHAALTRAGTGARFGIDCHTMLANGPPVGPDHGRPRPAVLLGDGNGTTFPAEWTATLASCLSDELETEVALNQPFSGGYIVRAHAAETPWIMLELSRAPFLSDAEKGRRVHAALATFCRTLG